jgi:hypothetical protein
MTPLRNTTVVGRRATDGLHERDPISDPKSRAKSVKLTAGGARLAEELSSEVSGADDTTTGQRKRGTSCRTQMGDHLRTKLSSRRLLTERGRPVARLSGIDVAPLLDQLAEQGRISSAPSSARPTAQGRKRVQAEGSVAELIVDERAARR